MSEKLILSGRLARKAEPYNMQPCVVEKVVEISDKDFIELISNPLKDNYNVITNLKYMWGDKNNLHCVLFINSSSGDGFLVDAEGYNYPRYSQYIAGARAIVKAHEQGAAMTELQDTIKSEVDLWISEHKNDKDPCISIEKFIEESGIYHSIEYCVEEAILQNPIVSKCDMQTGFIEVEIKPLVETKLICPLSVKAENEYLYELEEVSAYEVVDYADEINRVISKSMKIGDEDFEKHGLIAFSRNPRLEAVVESAFPSVEERNGCLYGVVTVKSYGELAEDDLEALTECVTGQLSDGWGEGFEQRGIKLGENEYYISFWNGDNYYLKPESEVFPEQEISPKM